MESLQASVDSRVTLYIIHTCRRMSFEKHCSNNELLLFFVPAKEFTFSPAAVLFFATRMTVKVLDLLDFDDTVGGICMWQNLWNVGIEP